MASVLLDGLLLIESQNPFFIQVLPGVSSKPTHTHTLLCPTIH